MEKRFLPFVWRYSRREQLTILAITGISFPLVYLSLEVPKIIVNDAIRGEDFPRRVLGFDLDQIPYLLLLSGVFLFLVAAINGVKWLLNTTVGMTGERMLRRLRMRLFEQVMRYRLSRFRTTKPGEVVQALLGEIEPIGGFVGEVIATPAFQGGLLGVNLVFIFVQNFWLGLAACALYPVQMVLIPRMQKKVVALNRQRAANTRTVADALNDSVAQVEEVHANGAARWRIAQVSARLHRNTLIRAELYNRKYTIKVVQNLLNQLTPFFFYSIGGWMVINGELDFGSLVAVLAAYKDLSAPFRELMGFRQRYDDFSGRYTYVIESFLGDDVHPPERLADAQGRRLGGPLIFEGVEGGPGAGGLTAASFEAPPGATVAVTGGDGGAREALLRMAAGLAEPQRGAVRLGPDHLADANLDALGASVGYVAPEPGLLDRSVRDNLVYGMLHHAPDLADRVGPEAAEMLREALRTDSTTADPDGDWVDYEAAGVADAAALEDRLVELAEAFGLAPDLVTWALAARLPAERARRWGEAVPAARAALLETVDAEELATLVSFWNRDLFNRDASLLDNILFAARPAEATDAAAAAAAPEVAAILATTGADEALARIGWKIGRELADAVETIGRDSRVLDGLGGYPKATVLAAADLVRRHAQSGVDGPPEAAGPDRVQSAAVRAQLVGLAARFTPARDQLDVVGPEEVARLMALRAAARPLVAATPALHPFGGDEVVVGLSVSENVLQGRKRHDRRAAWGRIDQSLIAAFEAAGLRRELVALGLSAPAGSAGGFSPNAKRRMALIRAVVKRPALVVLNGVAAGATPADAELRRAARQAAPDAILLFAAADLAAAEGADIIVCIDGDGRLSAQAADPGSRSAAQ